MSRNSSVVARNPQLINSEVKYLYNYTLALANLENINYLYPDTQIHQKVENYKVVIVIIPEIFMKSNTGPA